MFCYRIVPLDSAFVNEDGESGGRESLRVRGDGEERVGVNRCGLAEFAHAVAFSENHLVVFDYRHRKTGHLPILPGLNGVFVDLPEPRFDGLRLREE